MTRDRTGPLLRALCVCGLAAAALLPVPAPAHAQAARVVPPAGPPAGPPAAKAERPPGHRLGDLTIGEIRAHQSASRDGAAYLRIANDGDEDDALIDASTPFAKRVELHGPLPGGGVWETGPVDAVPVPAGRAVVLTGTGQRLRLVGLTGILVAGSTVPITLTFERGGAITVRARILSPNQAAAIIERSMLRPGSEPEPDWP